LLGSGGLNRGMPAGCHKVLCLIVSKLYFLEEERPYDFDSGVFGNEDAGGRMGGFRDEWFRLPGRWPGW